MLMKVEAIVRLETLAAITRALADVGITELTVLEARGCGRQKGVTGHFRGNEYTIPFLNKLKIEILMDESWVDQAVGEIVRAAWTGEIGDGKILILPVESAVYIDKTMRVVKAVE